MIIPPEAPRRSWHAGLVVTCEHASPTLPQAFVPLFEAEAARLGGPLKTVLASHRGWDPGAAELAVRLARAAGCEPLLGAHTRLLVDLNRSLHHPRLLSPVTRTLGPTARQALVAEYWQPHRARVEAAVQRAVQDHGRAVHLAMHSFTPTWAGTERKVDVGLLYDPRRPHERALIDALEGPLRVLCPALRVRRNNPYRGVADGLPTALRRKFAPEAYVGMELEVNAALVQTPDRWAQLELALAAALQSGLEALSHDSA